MTNPPEEFFRNQARLLEWMRGNPTVQPDGSNGALKGIDLSGLDLRGSKFHAARLDGANLSKANLGQSQMGNAQLGGATLQEANLEQTTLQFSHLDGANLKGVNLRRANCRDTDFREAILSEADLTGAHLESATLRGADLRGAKLRQSMMQSAVLDGCDLRGADLSGAELTRTSWRHAKIDAKTSLNPTVWRPEHDAPNDGADELSLGWVRRHALNWEQIRTVGQLPLFAGSYLLMTGSLASATAINWLNESGVVQTLNYPVPMPQRLTWLLLGSTLLAIGSTLFELVCPARVKEFSRTRWVEELRRSGVLYVSDSLQHPVVMAATAVLLVVGGGLVSWVFVDRLANAIKIAIAALSQV